MNFNDHSNFDTGHAFLGGSKYHWINYDEDKIATSYSRFLAVRRGVALHDLAERCIILGQKLPKSKKTLNSYVNDAIGFRMIPEQKLVYTENCHGTADAISFNHDLLRIHDLKTGLVPAHMEQLQIYASLFCLEYVIDPRDIDIELRIYQNDEILVLNPETESILSIIDKMIVFDKIINKIKFEEGL